MKRELYIKTPVFQSHFLKNNYNKNVSYKMECFQPTGSFKIRGMEAVCKHFIAEGKTNFISSSGGNGGYSLAYACKELGVKLIVILPKTTPSFMQNKIKNLGAKVTVFGNNWNEANDYAQILAEEQNLAYVHPFDHHLLWKGYESIIIECFEQIEQPDTIIVSVGGGGLLSGILLGLKKIGWENTKVITTEPEGAASFYESYKAKELICLEKIDTISNSLGAKQIAADALEIALNFNIEARKVADRDSLLACQHFLNEYNVLVEPACGAALSQVYDFKESLKENEKVLVIICGGASLSLNQFIEFQKEFTIN